jgi:hypothetical protein
MGMNDTERDGEVLVTFGFDEGYLMFVPPDRHRPGKRHLCRREHREALAEVHALQFPEKIFREAPE